MEGFLLIDKPKLITSFAVVKKVRLIVAHATGNSPKKIKVGHSGTLDPFASGLLIIMVGKQYTTQADLLLKQNKSYDVDMVLDSQSTTGDSEGQIESIPTIKNIPSKDQIVEVLKSFEGQIWQTPPIYSAIKVNGVRAYRLARDNQPVKFRPRNIFINNNQLIKYAYPLVRFKSDVSSGTYIRSLVIDMAKSINRVGYTQELRRTSIGLCSISQAITLEQLNEHNIADFLLKELPK